MFLYIQQTIRSRRDSNTSEISLSVESALECFDFLNAECDDDFADDNTEVNEFFLIFVILYYYLKFCSYIV